MITPHSALGSLNRGNVHCQKSKSLSPWNQSSNWNQAHTEKNTFLMLIAVVTRHNTKTEYISFLCKSTRALWLSVRGCQRTSQMSFKLTYLIFAHNYCRHCWKKNNNNRQLVSTHCRGENTQLIRSVIWGCWSASWHVRRSIQARGGWGSEATWWPPPCANLTRHKYSHCLLE